MPHRASFGGILNSSSTINGLRASVRNGERLQGERQEQGVTDIVKGHQQTLMAAYAKCRVAPGDRATEYRVPRGPPQRQIAPHVDQHHPADIWPRVSSSNTLFHSGTVFPIPHSRLSGVGSCLYVSSPRQDGRGPQRWRKTIAEAGLITSFRVINAPGSHAVLGRVPPACG